MSNKSFKKKKRILYYIFFICIVIFISYVLFCVILSVSKKSFPNIYAGEIPIGGRDKGEILQLLSDKNWHQLESNDLEVYSFFGKSISINPVNAGVLSSTESVADAAVNYGKNNGFFSLPIYYFKSISSKTDINKLSASLNENYIEDKIDALQLSLDSVTSQYIINESDLTLEIVKGYGSGLSLDKAELSRAILQALEERKSSLEFYVLKSEPSEPDFNNLYELVYTEPENAHFSDDGSHTIVDRAPGYSFDTSTANDLWNRASVGETISIPLIVSTAPVSADELRSNMYIHLLGAMTTKYNNSDDNRSSNVRLATSLVNGCEIYPGEEFSFNQTVGKRTAEAGFLMAPAYAGYDDMKEEIGGGVCQVSTGIYASALFAFLDISSHTCHVYPPNYIQLGTDATVSIPDAGREIDFKFINNKSYPIKIVGYCEETTNPKTGKPLKTVTIEIWGTLEDDDYMPIEFDNAWGDIYDYDRHIEPAFEDREGYRLQFTHDETEFEDDTGKGLRTLTYRRVYDSHGNLVEKKILNPMYSFGYGMDTYYYKQ